MLHCLYRQFPLPLGAVHNQRSLIGLENLIDLIITCLNHPAAANQTFLVSDDKDLSTTLLLQNLAKELNKPHRLISIPPVMLKWGMAIINKRKIAQRLLNNLQVDISKTKELLSWSPPISIDKALKRTAEWHIKQK